MKLADVQTRLNQLDLAAGQDLIYELLSAYGFTQTAITKLRNGTYDQEIDDNRVLWKKRVWDAYIPDADNDELLTALGRAQANNDVSRRKPRFYITRNDRHLNAVDNRTGDTLDTPLSELANHARFFMPWTGAEKTRTQTISYIDTRVAKQMAKLYDEIIVQNPELPDSDKGRSDLNVFFSRLLFCFFAEDTGVFPDGIFTDAINQLTATDGSDTAEFLDELFTILDTPDDERNKLPVHFEQFGYVNGSLFRSDDEIKVPAFSRKARNIVVDCGTLDWSDINPDIFGSMIQAVTAGEDRANLGMHYTSIENILKVLNPLFLDALEERFEHADTKAKLEKLLDHLGEIRVFDPACGSGNFLIVAYKRLRHLEHQILQNLVDLDGGATPWYADSRISLEHFHGIEIDDFAHDIAKLSLWFAKHQMNQELKDLFGHDIPLIPLTETGAIVCANSTRCDWRDICPPSETTYVCGNPPFAGSRRQTPNQKQDLEDYFENKKYPKRLNYVSIWLLKSASYVSGTSSKAGLVSTSAVSQGEHVNLLWPLIYSQDVDIQFAHGSFQWKNAANDEAHVSCVVIGLCSADQSTQPRVFYTDSSRHRCGNISPYLRPLESNDIVVGSTTAINDLPQMKNGSAPRDGGHLSLEIDEYSELRRNDPEAMRFVLSYVGSREALNALPRYCIWIEDDDLADALQHPELKRRIELVRSDRENGGKSKKDAANTPHRFAHCAHTSLPAIVCPSASSERRQYFPMGLVDGQTVVSNAAFTIADAKPWLFGLLQSRMHAVWVELVCARLNSDYQYGVQSSYNVFPPPPINATSKQLLSESALSLIAARERWPDRSLAKLYDPDRMPANLRASHEANDALVDGLYRKKPFESDTDRMELLLSMYRELVTDADDSKPKTKGDK